MDLLRITRDRPWFEQHGTLADRDATARASSDVCLGAFCRAADFVSVQAMLFNCQARNWWQQTKVLVRYQSRLTDG